LKVFIALLSLIDYQIRIERFQEPEEDIARYSTIRNVPLELRVSNDHLAYKWTSQE